LTQKYPIERDVFVKVHWSGKLSDQNPLGGGNQPGNPAFGRRAETPSPYQAAPEQYAESDYVARSPQDVLQPREVPEPPKRSRQARNKFVVFMNFCLSALVFVALGVGALFYFGKMRFEEAGPLQKAKTIVIEEGSSLSQIAGRLEAGGIISTGFLSGQLAFETGVKASGNAGSLKAGEYAFKPGMSMRDVMDTIVSGKGIIHKVAIPEGLTSFQIMQRIAANETLEGEMPTEIPVEGSIMPDTYPFQRGTTRAELLEQMRRQQERFLAEIWERRIDGLPLKTPQEMVTLASIVEKETGKGDERPRVASVFINRLNQGMRLQSDPTILYGIFGGEGKPKDRPIYNSDIETPTPYNTYTIDGLPPTPIANPGRAALEAVANPSRTEDLFFVADGTGGHVFAKTLKEHQANVRRWRSIEKRLKEEAEKAAAASQDTSTTN